VKAPADILKQYWGYDAFRPLQEDIIQSVLNGKDTLALLPTGGGKSICFQVPALCMEGICIVVSPLIALMKDQVFQLQKREIEAEAIYSGMSKREIDIILDNCIYGNIKFLYVSPERLLTEIFIERAVKMKVSLLAIDEAHCISQWGYDFRPPYLQIADFREKIPDAKLIALTASATLKVQQDIQDKLRMKAVAVFMKSYARKNLSYSVFKVEDKGRKLLEVLTNVQGSAVVYVRSRKRTEELAKWLMSNRISASYYHAGLNAMERANRQTQWIDNKVRVMVATNAFGMGIDKPDVRVVIHVDIPDSLEAYYQEAGRGGRDEKLAYAVMIYLAADVRELKERTLRSLPEVEYLKKVYQALANYFKLAVGSSQFVSFDFDYEQFIKTYQLNPFEAFASLKKLEEEGLIQLTESFYQPSRLFAQIDKQELYKIQVANANLDPVIKATLRLFGGEVFAHLTTISESDIARLANCTRAEVVKQLTYLDTQGAFVYEKMKDSPQVQFLTPRQDAAKLSIDKQRLAQRREELIGKVEAMVKYLQQEVRCRTQVIQEYFGEENDIPCGMCDYCIRQKKMLQSENDFNKLLTQLMDEIGKNQVSLEQLMKGHSGKTKEARMYGIRHLLDEEKVRYNEVGKLILT
jgi:ATP-dependent DNA helicase RecQ